MSQCNIRAVNSDPAMMVSTIHKLATENESLKRELKATDCLVSELQKKLAAVRELVRGE